MIHIQDFAHIEGTKALSGSHKSALVVAHTADALIDATAQDVHGNGAQSLYAARDIPHAIPRRIAEGGDDAVGCGVHI